MNCPNPVKRKDDFRADFELPEGKRAELDDYKNNRVDYDRGHMAPAGNMVCSKKAMSESFLLSNMAPQIPSFNRGIWNKLEGKVRKWALGRGELPVFTGPIFSGDYKTIGLNKVAVPSHFYKIVYDPRKKEVISFILPNKKAETNDLAVYLVSIREVEKRTGGLDFLSKLPDKTEDKVESAKPTKLWPLE